MVSRGGRGGHFTKVLPGLARRNRPSATRSSSLRRVGSAAADPDHAQRIAQEAGERLLRSLAPRIASSKRTSMH